MYTICIDGTLVYTVCNILNWPIQGGNKSYNKSDVNRKNTLGA